MKFMLYKVQRLVKQFFCGAVGHKYPHIKKGDHVSSTPDDKPPYEQDFTVWCKRCGAYRSYKLINGEVV